MKDMSYEEANDLINDITWKYNGNSITNEMICKCRDKCQEALEKQIPKKPKISKSHVKNSKFGICECGEYIFDHEKYCSKCGQALDWSDE